MTGRRAWGNPTDLRLDGFDAAGELVDSALGGVEPCRAEPVELLASLPERDRLVEARLAALQALDDPFELALSVLEGRLGGQRVSSTRAPKPPVPSSTSTLVPDATCELERTISPAARTIA